MSREIVINAMPEECRVAVLEAGRVAEIRIERADDRSLVGNVYLGRVDRILPGMQSAFVDVGLPRHAFLHVADIVQPDDASGLSADDAEEASGADEGGENGETDAPAPEASAPRIEELLRQGQDIVVQVTREPIGSKGARVTTHVTLAGKYLVYMPFSDHLGLSKRILDDDVRETLRVTMETLRQGVPGGFIVRTDAAGQSRETLEADSRRLRDAWAAMTARMQGVRPPACLHGEQRLPVRVVRDALSSELTRIVVDDDEVHDAILAFLREQAPDLAPALHRYRGPTGLFETFGLEPEIEKALRDRVWLKSGGYLVINQMEALVAVDVNTGKYTGGRRLEDTVLQTNLEAAREVARQLRLRDLGGIVVVDFIDMVEPENRRHVLRELEAAFARDRARTTVLGMSEFGLVEITRQRQKRSLERTLTEPCPYCSGSGRVKSPETTANTILRRIRAMAAAGPVREVHVRAHPEVAERLRRYEGEGIAVPEGLPIRLRVSDDATRHRETFELSD